MWSHLETPGMEHCRVVAGSREIVADGVVLGVENGLAFRLRYEVRCDPQWRVRRVVADLLNDGRQLSLSSDGAGRWLDESGASVPALDGCADVDITATPFTNTLPLRRLALRRGESADIKVAYILIPELRVAADEQRYTLLEASDAGGSYRFEQRGSGFTATLRVDAEGLVEEYPELFRRVWAS
jgi:hypothetical protein